MDQGQTGAVDFKQVPIWNRGTSKFSVVWGRWTEETKEQLLSTFDHNKWCKQLSDFYFF